MNAQAWKICLAATFGGSFLFMALVGAGVVTAQLNADSLPNFPWFPVPVLALVGGVAWWCQRRWDIGLNAPLRAPAGLVVAFAVTSMVAAHALWVLEKSYHGVTYQFPRGPDGTSALFLVTYWVALSLAFSTASEVCFRGIMQSQLARYLSLWPTITLVVLFNTFAHPWATLWERFFGVLAILLAWGWLRHISGSLRATILTHIAAVMGGDLIFLALGPVNFGELQAGTLVAVAAVGVIALAVSVWLSRLITSRAKPAGEASTAP